MLTPCVSLPLLNVPRRKLTGVSSHDAVYYRVVEVVSKVIPDCSLSRSVSVVQMAKDHDLFDKNLPLPHMESLTENVPSTNLVNFIKI